MTSTRIRPTLPVSSDARKDVPLFSGCYSYFPAALAGVARHSKMGNDKHNPGQPLHHSRGKSNDHADCIARHSMDIADLLAILERGQGDEVHEAGDDAVREAVLTEANALCWRALAWSQELHEQLGGAPLAPRARQDSPRSCTCPPDERPIVCAGKFALSECLADSRPVCSDFPLIED